MFADIIECDVLQPYADVQREIADLKAHPEADSEFVAQISRFTALRAEGWRLLVDACGNRIRRSFAATSRAIGGRGAALFPLDYGYLRDFNFELGEQ